MAVTYEMIPIFWCMGGEKITLGKEIFHTLICGDDLGIS